MTNARVTLPLDGIGKSVDMLALTVAATLVHQQRVIARSHERTLTTRYWYDTGSLVVGASADAAQTGRVYIENEVGSGILLAVTTARFHSQHASALVTATAPRIALRTFTFTQSGSPSGAALVGVKQDSTLPNKSALWEARTAKTNMTVTEVGDLAVFYPVVALTAVGACAPISDIWRPEPDRPLILRPGEGLMVKQVDAGTASDTRLVGFSFELEEWTVPA